VIAFLRALTKLITALIPLIEEHTRVAKLRRIRAEYDAKLEKSLVDPAAAFGDFDDDLLAEGVTETDNRVREGADHSATGRQLQGQ
jgi:hypothetical protein